MRALTIWFLVSLCLLGAVAPGASGAPLDHIERAPKGWRGVVFEPNFRFPAAAKAEARPWMTVSFRSEPERYLHLLLDYALEGQDRVGWRLRANRVRGWYHVPWLGPGPNGREFIHGLTRAHDFAPGELGAAQTACRQNWALAFFNDEGGAVLGRVWWRVAKGRGGPDLSALPFPAGTVAVKLVFTEATAADDAQLIGAPEIEANIHADANPDDAVCASAIGAGGKSAARGPKTLRLIQVDVSAREERAHYKTGWVFGSFVYDGTKAGSDPWAKLVPLGIMWGNDPQLSDAAVSDGMKPRQSILFDAYPGVRGLGRGGRMNGLVDERSSACTSCHMAAQWPSVAHMKAPADWASAKCWFRNLDARYPFGFEPGDRGGCGDPASLAKVQSLDFSLQLAIGLRNWSLSQVAHGKRAPTSLGLIVRNGEKLTVDGETSLPLRR